MPKMFTVYDSKVGAYLPPFYMRSRGEAARAWESTVNDQKTDFYRYPSDFTLFEIGEFCEDTGVCTMYETKRPVGTALEFRKSVERPVAEAPALVEKQGE